MVKFVQGVLPCITAVGGEGLQNRDVARLATRAEINPARQRRHVNRWMPPGQEAPDVHVGIDSCIQPPEEFQDEPSAKCH